MLQLCKRFYCNYLKCKLLCLHNSDKTFVRKTTENHVSNLHRRFVWYGCESSMSCKYCQPFKRNKNYCSISLVFVDGPYPWEWMLWMSVFLALCLGFIKSIENSASLENKWVELNHGNWTTNSCKMNFPSEHERKVSAQQSFCSHIHACVCVHECMCLTHIMNLSINRVLCFFFSFLVENKKKQNCGNTACECMWMNVCNFIGDVVPFVMSQFVYLIVRLFNFQTCFRTDIVVVVVDTDNDDAKFKPLISIHLHTASRRMHKQETKHNCKRVPSSNVTNLVHARLPT